MTADAYRDDAMHPSVQRHITTPHSVCKWFLSSGSCRSKACPLPHIKSSAQGVEAHAGVEQRIWSLSSSEEEYQEQHTWRFSVASYNILADKYARHYRSYLYHEVPATYLDWHHRRAAIVAELGYLLPDIICLQEVDRYEDLEAELEQLGYCGIYLQRDGGRRDGCATFWKQSLLRPALVRQVRFSQYELKDNVALLVLFEPNHGASAATQQGAAAAMVPEAAAATAPSAAGTGQEQPSSWTQQDSFLSSPPSSQQQQQQQQQTGESPQQGFLSQWLPKGWLWSNASNNSNASHMRSSRLLLRPAQGQTAATQQQLGSSPGQGLYQVPVQLSMPHSTSGSSSRRRSSFEPAASAASVPYSTQSSSSASGSVRTGSKQGHRRSGSGSGSVNSRLPPQAQPQQQQQQQHAPDWVHCALLVANTHIIFTPDKGDVKLGQARMLVQEATQMAQFYLEQQQQQQVATAPGSIPDISSSNNSTSQGAAAASADAAGRSAAHGAKDTQAVAAILTGDFNATPNSPLYAYLSQGLLDLQNVSRRNVSHMVGNNSISSGGGGHSHHHGKGYRGFRRAIGANRRRSAEYQQQQQQQQQPLPAAAASAAMTAGGRAGSGQHAAAAAVAASGDAVDGTPIQQQQSNTNGWQSSQRSAAVNGASDPRLSAQGSAAAGGMSTQQAASDDLQQYGQAAAAAGGPVSAAAGGSPVSATTTTIGSSNSMSSSPACQPANSLELLGASPQRSSGSSLLSARQQHRWTDREVRRAAGMSYDELVEASLSYLSESDADTSAAYDTRTQDAQISRAAAAFAAEAAAGSGAAAAAAAAASVAAGKPSAAAGRRSVEKAAQGAPGSSSGGSSSNPAGGVFSAAVVRPSSSGREPLLLQHGLKLQSSYRNVLGQEPEYTSSHSQFMDTCDYIWYTSAPLTAAGQQQARRRQQQGSQQQQDSDAACSSGASSSSSASSMDSDGSNDGDDEQACSGSKASHCHHYALRPVAVLQPPDGMKLNKGLPSKHLGSDHISLLTDFELVMKQQQ